MWNFNPSVSLSIICESLLGSNPEVTCKYYKCTTSQKIYALISFDEALTGEQRKYFIRRALKLSDKLVIYGRKIKVEHVTSEQLYDFKEVKGPGPIQVPSTFEEYYNLRGFNMLRAVVVKNPHMRELVGNFIYYIVEVYVGELLAPKITGMLLDVDIIDKIRAYLCDYKYLISTIKEAKKCLLKA